MTYVKLDDNTMVFGDPIDWEDENLHQILFGLCCASIDESSRPVGFRHFMCEGSHTNF